MSTGFDYNRMNLLLAVLEKRAGSTQIVYQAAGLHREAQENAKRSEEIGGFADHRGAIGRLCGAGEERRPADRFARAGALCRTHRHPGPANAGTDGHSNPNHLHNHAGTDGTKPAAEL